MLWSWWQNAKEKNYLEDAIMTTLSIEEAEYWEHNDKALTIEEIGCWVSDYEIFMTETQCHWNWWWQRLPFRKMSVNLINGVYDIYDIDEDDDADNKDKIDTDGDNDYHSGRWMLSAGSPWSTRKMESSTFIVWWWKYDYIYMMVMIWCWYDD